MKNRLLEDIGDSQSAVPVRPARQAAPPPQADAVPPQAPVPSGVPEAPARQRAGVWRERAPDPPLAPPPPRAAEASQPFFVPPRVEPTIAPSPAPEPPRAAPRISPELASFSSPEPDWSIPPQPEPPPWTERWGRKALGWSIGLAALVAVAGTAAWMVQETQVESTLAVVADHSPAQASSPAPAVPAAAPPSEPGMEAAPPLKLLPPEPVATVAEAREPAPMESDAIAPVAAETETAMRQAPALADVAPTAADAAAVAATPKAVAAPPAKKPAAKRVPARRLAAAAPDRRKRQAAKKPAPAPARQQVLARAPALPARTVPAQEPDPESPLAETLRLCRAAGYHATACLKRGCEATRFGLVCRG